MENLPFTIESSEEETGAIITMRSNIDPSLTARAVTRAFKCHKTG